MLSTLHGYILRDLLKTFVLAALALTGLFTMAGALYNILRYEGLSASDIFYIFPYLLPGAVAVALPVAALFSGTIVYGRFAADNELLACRAAGINIWSLFLAAGVLAIFVTLATTLLVNFTMPDFVKRIERYARANVGQFAYQQLRSRGYIRFDKKKPHEYLVTCEGVELIDPDALERYGFERPGPGLSYFWIDNPRLLVQEADAVSRFATAEGGVVQFDSRKDPVRFDITLAHGQSLEFGKRAFRFGEQKVGIDLNIQVPLKPWLVDLGKLIYWRSKPWDGSDVERDLRGFLRQLRTDVIARRLVDEIAAQRGITLTADNGTRYAITCESAGIEDRRIVLNRVQVEGTDARDRKTRFEAPKASLMVQAASQMGVGEDLIAASEDRPPSLVLRLQETPQERIVEIVSTGRQRERQNRKEANFDGLAIPDTALQTTESIGPEMIMNNQPPAEISETLVPKFAEAVKKLRQFALRVNATMHVRLGLSASALVIVLMGALLGVIFRGSHPLAAFALSCVPAALVITLICITGYPMAQRPSTAQFGIGVIWGSLAGLALIDLALLRFGVKR